MKRQTWIRMGLVALVVVALLAWAFAPRPVDVEVAAARSAAFRTTVDEDGKTRLRDRYQVSAPLAGRLSRIALREGDAVEAGAVVATLTPAVSPLLDERTARELRARVATGEANMELAQARVARARVALAQARSEARRSEQLARDGFVSPTKLETDRLAVQAAVKEVESAQQAVEVAERERSQAQAALGVSRLSEGGKGGFAVKAPVNGRVLRVLQTSEGVVALGTPLIELGDTAQMEIVAELLTTDALQTRPGAAVLIERWGGPGTLQGVVRRVEPSAVTKVSALGVEEQRVKVLIDLTSPPAQWAALGDGFRVSVRIVTQAVEGVVVVPSSAVFPLPGARQEAAAAALSASAPASASAPVEGEPAPTMGVFVVDGRHARLVPVELGGRNGVEAWVRSGLKPGETVIVYPPAAVKDGVRVAVRKV